MYIIVSLILEGIFKNIFASPKPTLNFEIGLVGRKIFFFLPGHNKINFTDLGCYEQTKKENALMNTRLFINKTYDIPNTAIVPFNTD